MSSVLWGGSEARLATLSGGQSGGVFKREATFFFIRGAYFFLRAGIWLVGALSALYCTCKNKQEFGRRQVIRAQRSTP